MTISLRLAVATFSCGLSLLLAGTGAAQDGPYQKLKLSLGYHFSSGKYGTSERSEIAYVPFTIRAERDLWTFEVTVPYLRVSGTAPEGPNGPIPGTSGEADGLGDVTSRGSYTLLPMTSWMPYIDLIGRVKYPTASHSRGLGTGQFDFGFETELAWSVGRFTPFVGAGYRFLGSPSDFHLHDVALASVGSLYRVVEPVWAGLFLDYRQAAAASTGERLEIVPYVLWKVDRHWSVDLYVSAGLASGSPDAGIGLQIGYTL